MKRIKGAFPWAGGKGAVADAVWSRFGTVNRYIEPFAGKLEVLLANQSLPSFEIVNDINHFIANFYRAVQADPLKVAAFADQPVQEVEMYAWEYWLVNREEFKRKMEEDPFHYDAQIAGRWVWGQCLKIGGGWCDTKKDRVNGMLLPAHRAKPQLTHRGGLLSEDSVTNYVLTLHERLKNVRICCGDWSRVVTKATLGDERRVGVFLDPPYAQEGRDKVYVHESDTAADEAREWCLANGSNNRLRIAIAGYRDRCGHEVLEQHGWRRYDWHANGGYSNQKKGSRSGNNDREAIWFSPYCNAATLFELDHAEQYQLIA